MGGFRAGRGFTLVELLVVMGIIGVLIALALPVLSSAQQSSRRVVCLSKLKQVGVAFSAYQDEHKGLLPVVQTLPVDPTRPSIIDAMDGYLPAGDGWRCPSDPKIFPEYGISYEYFLGLVLGLMSEDQARMLLRERPAGLFVMTDAEGWHPGGPDGLDRNAVFLDGHVDWLEQTVEPGA